MFKLQLAVFYCISSSGNYWVGLKKKSAVVCNFFLHTAVEGLILSASITLHTLISAGTLMLLNGASLTDWLSGFCEQWAFSCLPLARKGQCCSISELKLSLHFPAVWALGSALWLWLWIRVDFACVRKKVHNPSFSEEQQSFILKKHKVDWNTWIIKQKHGQERLLPLLNSHSEYFYLWSGVESNLCIISSDIGINTMRKKWKLILNPKVILMFCFILASSLEFTKLNYVEVNIWFCPIRFYAAFLGFTVVFPSIATWFSATLSKTKRRWPEHKSWCSFFAEHLTPTNPLCSLWLYFSIWQSENDRGSCKHICTHRSFHPS